MFKVEISILGSAWKTIHTVGNVHAAEVFGDKRKGARVEVRVVDLTTGKVIAA